MTLAESCLKSKITTRRLCATCHKIINCNFIFVMIKNCVTPWTFFCYVVLPVAQERLLKIILRMPFLAVQRVMGQHWQFDLFSQIPTSEILAWYFKGQKRWNSKENDVYKEKAIVSLPRRCFKFLGEWHKQSFLQIIVFLVHF